MAPAPVTECEVCGQAIKVAILKDGRTGLSFGSCCEPEMGFAGRIMEMAVRRFGFAHPQS
jgi:hypothetical protein